MKNLTSLLILFIAISTAFSQAPQSFNYQGVARNSTGTPLASQNISVKASILDSSTTGPVQYAETQTTVTNQFGLFTISIGTGTPITGTVSAIKWATGNKYLKIEFDPNGGTNYIMTGTTQMLSVPYALYAANGGSSGILTGTILPFAGITPPTGYLLCDGSQISRTTYSNLFTVLSSTWGNGDGSTTFHLPDLRGRFMRGVDGTAGNDPDKDSRSASNAGGNTGNNVGSIETDGTAAHSHSLNVLAQCSGTISVANASTMLAGSNNGGGFWGTSGCNVISNTASISSTGGTETRPKNVNVNFMIKY